MSRQNIFDDETFFNGYLALRQNPDSANELEEKPAILSMLGPVDGKSIIDLGCGYGENCAAFSRMNAAFVLGIDISERMLEIANRENRAANIEYLHMAMEDINRIGQSFDVVVSSLAMHYIRDYEGLLKRIYALLNPGGILVFSQEHPLTTAPVAGAKWMKNDDGSVDHYRLTDYARPGERSVSWIVDGIIKYHRTFSDIVNGLVRAGFIVEQAEEPVPAPETIKRLPGYTRSLDKPDFLIVKARKPEASRS